MSESTKPAPFNYSWDTQLLLDILTTAAEWSCTHGMWGQMETYQWSKWYENPDEPFDSEPRADLKDEVLLRVRDASEDYECDSQAEYDEMVKDTPFVDVTLASLRKAANRALAEYKHLFGSGPTREGFKVVDLDYDVIGADVILQFAVFGEVIYG